MLSVVLAALALGPGDFTTRIDNPYWPMRPGARWVYREGRRGRVVVTVTRRKRRIANGVTARVVRDVVTERGRRVEVTDDWYAQDRAGNVWYLGEDTTEYDARSRASKAGSWEAGRDGAEPGIVMPADPQPGMTYRQEHAPGEAEDAARVLSLDEKARVPAGRFKEMLMTKDYTPLEPWALEYKFYARGVGPVLVLSPTGGGSERLLRYRR
jgi:hypothetical protein